MPLPLIVHVHSHVVLNRFVPSQAFGACIDGGDTGETKRVFTTRNVAAMRSMSLASLAYRLRTELAGEAWHWNPEGTFSEGDRGYWTSSAKTGKPIRVSYGYRLPRRGDTFDQANDDGYSRLTDGDPATFWKSNPALDAANPQWVLIRLPKPQTVDTIRVRWADPYALRYRVEYWAGDDSPDIDGGQQGVWRVFPQGAVEGRGGDEVRALGPIQRVRWVRLRLLVSSYTPRKPRDRRDGLGFAIREIELGKTTNGRFADALVHRRDHAQSATWVSSTDPWHRASDRDPRTEQPGLDTVFRSGLSNGRPVLMPAGVLYDTPANMAALLRWLRARRYPVRGFEMGEEPDGQVCAPEDYAALYLQAAAALRAVDPQVLLGGPGFQTVESDYAQWTLNPPSLPGVRCRGEKSEWASRLAAALRNRHASDRLGFLSFEWYPFDDVAADPSRQLARASGLLERALARLPKRPLFMTEYGYSAYASPAGVDLPAALLNLDIVGAFLAHGGRAAYLYGYPPSELAEDRKGFWGALAPLLPDGARLPTYWAARLLTEDWCADSPPRFPRGYELSIDEARHREENEEGPGVEQEAFRQKGRNLRPPPDPLPRSSPRRLRPAPLRRAHVRHPPEQRSPRAPHRPPRARRSHRACGQPHAVRTRPVRLEARGSERSPFEVAPARSVPFLRHDPLAALLGDGRDVLILEVQRV